MPWVKSCDDAYLWWNLENHSYFNINKYIYIYIMIYIYININQYFISFYMLIYRIFPILLDYQRLRPVDVDQAPREAHQLSVEKRLEHLEGSGRPSG